MDKDRVVIEGIKLAVSNLQLQGVSPQKALVEGILFLLERYRMELQKGVENFNSKAVMNKALLLIQAYLEMGFFYLDYEKEFEEVFRITELTEDEIQSFKRRSALKIKLSKARVGAVLGRWNPKQHSDTKEAVIQEIIQKIEGREVGEYFYFTKQSNSEQNEIFQLVVEKEGNYLCHLNTQQYYEFESKRRR